MKQAYHGPRLGPGNAGSHEILISPDVLEQMLAKGYEQRAGIRTIEGPGPEAKIVDVKWRVIWGHPQIVLVYDRPVAQPLLQSFTET